MNRAYICCLQVREPRSRVGASGPEPWRLQLVSRHVFQKLMVHLPHLVAERHLCRRLLEVLVLSRLFLTPPLNDSIIVNDFIRAFQFQLVLPAILKQSFLLLGAIKCSLDWLARLLLSCCLFGFDQLPGAGHSWLSLFFFDLLLDRRSQIQRAQNTGSQARTLDGGRRASYVSHAKRRVQGHLVHLTGLLAQRVRLRWRLAQSVYLILRIVQYLRPWTFLKIVSQRLLRIISARLASLKS